MSSKANVEAGSASSVAPSEPSSDSVGKPEQRPQKRTSRKNNGPSSQPKTVYYQSPNLCCCDLQSGLICMAIIDILVAFIALVIFLAAWAGPSKKSSSSTVVEDEPHYHHRRHYYIYHRPRYYYYYWKRAVADAVTNSTTTKPEAATTIGPEKPDNTFYIIGVVVSIVMMAACIGLLIGAIIRSRGATWGSFGSGWFIFVGAATIYMINVIGAGDAGDSAGSIILLVLALLYRIYETFVVYYFVKEPPPQEVRYVAAPGETVYATSPVVYQPAYAPAYYGPRYYPYGYYDPGYGFAAGVGLGLAMDAHYDDYYY